MRLRTFIETCLLILAVSGLCLSEETPFISMTGDCRYPLVASEGTNLFIVFQIIEGRSTNLYFRRSTDEGATWTSARKISNEKSDCMPPTIAVNSGIVHAAWIDNGERIDGEVYYARSLDGGETWEKNMILVGDANSARYPSIACSGNNIYLIWQDMENKVYFKVSRNKGQNWENETLLGKVGKHSCYCFPPAVACNGNEVTVVWTNFNEDKKGLNIRAYGFSLFKSNKKMLSSVVSRSSCDNGRTWSKERILSSTQVAKETQDEIDNPTMLSDGSQLYLFWLARHNLPLGEILYARFDPKTEKKQLTGKSVYLNDKRSPKRPSVVFDKAGNLHMTWASFFGGESIVHYGTIDPAGNMLAEKKDLTSKVGRYHNPTITRTASGFLQVYWYDEPKDKEEWSRIFLKTSKDNGLTWEEWGSQIKDTLK
jgi:hypothetical protein